MDAITKLIRTEIIKQYGNIRKFSKLSGIPYSTIFSALTKGIGGTSYETVVKICNLLNLKQIYDADVTVLNDMCYEICAKLSALDERAVHTVGAIVNVEHERCQNENALTEAF